MSQKNLTKTTSLQAWDKLIKEYFGKNLRIEKRKDREIVYEKIKTLGLPCEKYIAFSKASKVTKKEFTKAVNSLGFPYWISLVPLPEFPKVNRLSKLCIHNINTGWQFISALNNLEKYKLLIMQYPDNPKFKGTAIVTRSQKGIIDFALGDNHYQLSIGAMLTDPATFDSKDIRYSKTVVRKFQDQIIGYTRKHPGYYEFQYGQVDGKYGLTFFDYHDKEAYEDIEDEIKNLRKYINSRDESNTARNILLTGLPASSGKVVGRCKVVLSTKPETFKRIKKGDILVSDITTPDMTIAISKAGAIITDLGGMTSHAAIICRELDIPCIVGTWMGTRVLREGQRVFVDAERGIVVGADEH